VVYPLEREVEALRPALCILRALIHAWRTVGDDHVGPATAPAAMAGNLD